MLLLDRRALGHNLEQPFPTGDVATLVYARSISADSFRVTLVSPYSG